MSMSLMAQAMKIKVGNPIRKLVLIKLADNSNDKGECWPSYQHIADQCECSRAAVRTHIDALINMGILSKENRLGVNNGKGNTSNLYYLNLDNPIPLTSTPPVLSDSIPPISSGSTPMLCGGTPPVLSDSTRTYHSSEPVKEPLTPIVPTGDDCVKTIFEFWKEIMNHPDAKLDEKRRKRIHARLKEKLTTKELCDAISGALLDPWLMGKNPQNRRYDGIETIFRDRAQVERLRDLSGNKHAKAIANGKYSAVTARNLQNLMKWAGTGDETGAPF